MLLTKTKYLVGLQCPKYLWVMFNEKDRIPEPDEATQALFDQGHEIGDLAKSLFPEGLDLTTLSFMDNIKKAQEFLVLDKPIFEPGFMVANLYSRADILVPNEEAWDIVEVKSGTRVKDVNIQDVAFQKHVYELSGLKIKRCFLMHVNNQYVLEDDTQPEKLLTKQDITKEVDEAIKAIGDRIMLMFKIIKGDCPEEPISKRCNDPYECALIDECWDFLPKGNVFDLSRGQAKSFELLSKGIVHLKDIPDDFRLTKNQEIQKRCADTDKPHIDKEKIREFLDQIEKPIAFMDFETFGTAIPIFKHTRPYQQIPFQWSVHIMDDEVIHKEFLAGTDDPRIEFIETLKKALPKKGSVLAYNKSFEITRMRDIAKVYPEYHEWVESIVVRTIDLMEPFSKFYYYDPKQEGSASIKKVLPTLSKKSYDEMEISDGKTASLRFLSILSGKAEDIEKTRKDLLKYCRLDTKAMVLIYNKLKAIVDAA